MRIVQVDPGADGWWALVGGDDLSITRLLHVDDEAGLDAPQPDTETWTALYALATTPAEVPSVKAEDGTVVGDGVAEADVSGSTTALRLLDTSLGRVEAHARKVGAVWAELDTDARRDLLDHSPVLRRVIALGRQFGGP